MRHLTEPRPSFGCPAPLRATLLAALLAAPLPAAAQTQVVPIPGVSGSLSSNRTGNGAEAGFIVTGPFARQMYDAIPGDPFPDQCEPTSRVKGNPDAVHCVLSPDGDAMCSFGFDFGNQTLTSGPLVC